MNKDLEHLRLLSIFHYVVGGILAFFGCFPLIHLAVGISLLLGFFPENPQKPNDAAVMKIMGTFFVIVPTIVILTLWALAVLTVFAGRKLSKHQSYTFCLVVAGIICLFAPFGTVLGVFTIIVLLRDSVKTIFGVQTPMTNSQTSGGSAEWR